MNERFSKANNDFSINTHRNAHIATKLFLHPETLETSVNKEIEQQKGDTQEGILRYFWFRARTASSLFT